MTESMFQKQLILARQINQKDVCFVITEYFLNKNFKYGPYFVMVAMMYYKNQQILKILPLFMLGKMHTGLIFYT